MSRAQFVLLAILLAAITVPLALQASDSGDRVQVGRRIVVSADEDVGDLVCVGCAIVMEGTCHDVVAVGGSITVDGTVHGDLVAVGGSAQLSEKAEVDGDVATIGGRLWRHPNSVVRGNITAHSGAPIFLGMLLIPLIPVILIIALIVWLLKPSRPQPPVRA